MISILIPLDFESGRLTNPLPQVVLTSSKTDFLTFEAEPERQADGHGALTVLVGRRLF